MVVVVSLKKEKLTAPVQEVWRAEIDVVDFPARTRARALRFCRLMG